MFGAFLRVTVGRSRSRLIAERAALYARTDIGRADIEDLQVRRFNAVWGYCLDELPFYRAWADEWNLPSRIENLSELAGFPVLTKSVIVERADEVFRTSDGGTVPLAYSTGGTAGTPARYPRGVEEASALYANTYVGRSWWGIHPFDSYVHVWGHAHLFGAGGLSRLVQKYKRRVLDRLVNATRVNAYDMTTTALESHLQVLLRRNPRYLIGYTSAIFKLARHAEMRTHSLSKLTKLQAVVVTAETVTAADVEVITRVFGVPVVIEYGAAETGVIATSRGGSLPLQVLWNSFVIRVDDSAGDITVTTIDDRRFPLINYAIGDRAEGGDRVLGNALTLGAVVGRAKDMVRVSTQDREQLELSAILPVHLLKSESAITAVQLRQEDNGSLRIFLSASEQLDLDAVAEVFRDRLRIDHPTFDPQSVSFEQLSEPVLTKAGKQALFI